VRYLQTAAHGQNRRAVITLVHGAPTPCTRSLVCVRSLVHGPDPVHVFAGDQ
jgi:hypothetical protein